MLEAREAAVAGQFYPGSAAELERDVDALLRAAATEAPCPKVIVAPHAGYIYSGSIAAEVYARLRQGGERISRVVLLGPSHRVGFRGIAASSAGHFRTPLGDIPIDRDALDAIAALPGVVQRDDAHALEHSLEVHLPFLQRSLGSFGLVPLVVGDAAAAEVAAVIDALWGGPETLLVISSDLSHFLPYQDARSKDLGTARKIESLEADLTGDQACGCRPLNGLLTVLKRRGLAIERVDVKNSGDTAGNLDRVVGYGAWVVNETGKPSSKASGDDEADAERPLSLAQRQQLLQLARQAIVSGFGKDNLDIPLAHYHPDLHAERGSFVTLNLSGNLRGCIGSLQASRPLVVDVAHNAMAAAFRDPRFQPLSAAEYTGVDLHISVLNPARPITVGSRAALAEYLRPGVHGLILQQGQHRATYLPSVWKHLPDPDRFIGELRAKAGLPREGWSRDTQVSVYTTEEFS